MAMSTGYLPVTRGPSPSSRGPAITTHIQATESCSASSTSSTDGPGPPRSFVWSARSWIRSWKTPC
jgi:hypothetical protein